MRRRSSLFFLDLDSLFHVRPGVNAGNGPERGPDPVDDEELHGGVAATAELEARGEDGVEDEACFNYHLISIIHLAQNNST